METQFECYDLYTECPATFLLYLIQTFYTADVVSYTGRGRIEDGVTLIIETTGLTLITIFISPSALLSFN